MAWIIEGAEEYLGQRVANGQCVRFLQEAGGLPHTSKWRPGDKVRGSGCEPGTCIATFDPNGRYGNHVDGRSHAAIFLEERAEGLLVIDQWVGHPVAHRTIRFRGGSGRRVNDGDAFCIIEEEE
jgi:hypothetical protein